MASHRRNWNSDFENFAFDLINNKEEFFSDESMQIYNELTAYANDEINSLNQRVSELEEENDDLRVEVEELSNQVSELDNQTEGN